MTAASNGVAFVCARKIVARFLFNFKDRHLRLFHRGILRARRLRDVVVSYVIIPREVRRNGRALPVRNVVPPRIHVRQPRHPPGVTIWVGNVSHGARDNPREQNGVAREVSIIVVA